MTSPILTSFTAYAGDNFVVLTFNAPLDAAHPPGPQDFFLATNLGELPITAISIDAMAGTVKLSFAGNLPSGEFIEVVYQDPTGGDDINALQGADGADVATLSEDTLITTRPAPTTLDTPTLAPASDSGAAGDGITNVTTPVVTGTAAANATIKLYDTDGTTLLGTTTADGAGSWSITSSVLGAGSHSLRVTQTDAGNQTSALSTGLALTIDTSVAAPGAPALALASDSGTPGDGITNVATPTFTGLAEANASVMLYANSNTLLGSTTADGSGNWSVTSSALSDGQYSVTAIQTDVAGNVSSASTAFAYRLDTNAPVSTALDRSSVPASSATSGAFVASLLASDANNVTFAFAGGNGSNDADNAKFTIDGDTLMAAQDLASGTYRFYVTATDSAGNAAFQELSLNVVSAPTVISIDLIDAATAPTNATSVSYIVTFDQEVSGVNVGDFSLTTTGTASGTVGSMFGSGNSYTVTVNGLAGDGTVRLDLNANGTGIQNASGIALAGGFTAGDSVNLDHTAPTAPASFTLVNSDDSGISNSDAITSMTTPRLSGTGEANVTVNLYDTDGTTLLGTTLADAEGHWTISSSMLEEGTHTLTVRQVDAAGNVSAPSPGLSVTIDTIAPEAGAAPLLAAESDSGAPGDGITTVSRPVLTGTAEEGALVTLYDSNGITVLGTATASETGDWSITASTLAVGAHALSYKSTDLAGNVSAASAALNLTIEVPPAAPPPPAPPAPPPPAPPAPPSTPTQPAPPPLVDGVAVESRPTILADGSFGTKVTVPVITLGRNDSSGRPDAADIVLARSGATDTLRVEVGNGIGLTAVGGPSNRVSTYSDDTIGKILTLTKMPLPDQSYLWESGSDFIKSLPGETTLVVQQITPESSPTTVSNLTITGTSSTTERTALVIDAQNLGAGNTIELKSVDYSTIIGNANIVASTAGQMLVGDSAAQQFTISGGQSSVYSGGGNDAIQMLSSSVPSIIPSNDIVHGGQGSDVVGFSGVRTDYRIEKFNAHTVVTELNGNKNSVKLINVETIKFADTELAVSTGVTVSTVAALYGNILGRQADLAGIEFWSTAAQRGLTLGTIAVEMIKSGEASGKLAVFNGSAAHDINLLYQTLFNRNADDAGLAYWVGSMQAGMSLEQVADQFITISTEFVGQKVTDAQMNFFF
ncbi:Ig-like domain-containing protein [Massilia sp. H6]|uniref:Ig-like domain-containing protein n=1 Tax=Massilia sp. H6 TaxID=2970464 RepID=UPI002168FA67|nr:Ig-like domain-containing protein [Massilia sp. H6]UVW28130.1 Ig-like domain-containing protein [Massilia sp. H6]